MSVCIKGDGLCVHDAEIPACRVNAIKVSFNVTRWSVVIFNVTCQSAVLFDQRYVGKLSPAEFNLQLA